MFNTSTFVVFILLAVLIEAICQGLKPIYAWLWSFTKKELPGAVDNIFALIIGVLVAVGASADMFAALDVPLSGVPYLGMVLTGIILSRGGNVLHDLFNLIKSLEELTKKKNDALQ